MSNIIEELSQRGLLNSHIDGIETHVQKPITVYNGFDPTGDSLHIGHLVPMVALARWQRMGHTPIALAGGGTGLIGDPSGRSSERQLLTREHVDANVAAIKVQLQRFLDFDVKSNRAQLVNNADWLSELSMFDFLRDVGKYFTVNYMMAKESVKTRLGRDGGISYTEFSYMLLQSYDFLHLNRAHGCTVQAGGSDQWGNITAGVTLTRKVTAKQIFAVSYPLITRADGTKFGKSASGEGVWLDPKRTSPYRFYQFLMNIEDEKVVEALNFYTFLPHEEIADYAQKTIDEPHRRQAQKKLAQEVTRMVHGEATLTLAQQASKVLFGGSLEGLSAEQIHDIFANVPSSTVSAEALSGDGALLADLMAAGGLANSKGDAKRAIKGGGVYINNQRAQSPAQTLSIQDTIEGRFIILRRGKKRYHLLQVQR